MFFKLYIAIGLILTVFSMGRGEKLKDGTMNEIILQVWANTPLFIVGLSIILSGAVIVRLLALR